MIEVKDLVKKYGDHIAVDHLSFTVRTGQIFGFLGPNGAGKSTTMNIMTGYMTATEGEVLVDGIDIQADPLKAKRRIGYLPEVPPLYLDMTVQEYLMFAAELKSIEKGLRQSHINNIMEMTRLGGVENRLLRNLSKGYRQRVGLAQALIGSPGILILDEPTVGLDPQQVKEMRDLIRSLAKDHTIIISSHILSEIQEMCDHILIMNHGKKVANGTPAELERHLSGEMLLEITVRGTDGALNAAVSSIQGVRKITFYQTGEEGTAHAKIAYDSEIREAVSSACAATGLPLLELRRSNLSMEEIFLKIISDESAPLKPTEPAEERM